MEFQCSDGPCALCNSTERRENGMVNCSAVRRVMRRDALQCRGARCSVVSSRGVRRGARQSHTRSWRGRGDMPVRSKGRASNNSGTLATTAGGHRRRLPWVVEPDVRCLAIRCWLTSLGCASGERRPARGGRMWFCSAWPSCRLRRARGSERARARPLVTMPRAESTCGRQPAPLAQESVP
jgi:hypothetical protein